MLTSCLNASAWVFCWLNVLFMLHCMKTLCPHSSWYCWWFNSRIMLVAQSWWVCTYCPTSQGTVEWGCYWSAFHVIHVKRMWFSLIFPVGYAWKWGIHPQNNYLLYWMGTMINNWMGWSSHAWRQLQNSCAMRSKWGHWRVSKHGLLISLYGSWVLCQLPLHVTAIDPYWPPSSNWLLQTRQQPNLY